MDPRILVVDDDTLIRQIMVDGLESLPATVFQAARGEDAIRVAKAERPDLIFLDMMMPGMDGFEVAEALKQDPTTAEIPLVFLSAMGTATQKVRGLELGAEDYLSKPVDPEELKARVRSILRRTRRPAAAGAPEPAAAPEPAPAASGLPSGQLQAMPLPTLLRWLEMERRTGRLRLTRSGQEGEIGFRQGQIARARLGERRGEAALYELLSWKDGSFEILPAAEGTVRPEEVIRGQNEELLQAGLKRLEEIPALRSPFPVDAGLEIPTAIRSALEALPPADLALVALLDGTRGLDQVLAASPHDAWSTLQILQRLLRLGALGWPAGKSGTGQAVPARRALPHIALPTPLQYEPLKKLSQTDRYTVSGRGMFVQTPTPLEMGEQVLLRFRLPERNDWVTAVGQVVWRNATATRGKAEELGMMLQFVEIGPEDQAAIEASLVQGVVAAIAKGEETP